MSRAWRTEPAICIPARLEDMPDRLNPASGGLALGAERVIIEV